MSPKRLEAFSDGVIAILITIMVLELKVPHGSTWSSVRPEVPVFLTYLLSFVILGIYWNNHHHLLLAADRINGWVLWANLHLLFWLSLFPFFTGWMGENHFATVPTVAYGVVLLAAALAFFLLKTVIVLEHGRESPFAVALGRDLKGKLSPVIYALSVALGIVDRWLAVAGYVIVALMWFIPDRRLEPVADGPRAGVDGPGASVDGPTVGEPPHM